MAEKMKEISYEALKQALRVEYQEHATFRIVEKTKNIASSVLYNQVKELTDLACPTELTSRVIVWRYFFFPLKFEGKPAYMPLTIVKLHNANEATESYLLVFSSSDTLSDVQVVEGTAPFDKLFSFVISSAKEVLLKKENTKAEKMVPYHFRTGKIKGKYLLDPSQLISEEEVEEIRKEYREHLKSTKDLPNARKFVSLNQYLYAASVAIKAVFPEYADLPPLETYRKTADFRDGYMLSISNPDSVEEFKKWYESGIWQGSHPFEIIAGYSTVGILLYPPKEGGYFILKAGSSLYYPQYVKALRAMMQAKIPVKADINTVLRFLTGNSCFAVNAPNKECEDYVFYYEIPEEKLKYVKWDKLEAVKPKGESDCWPSMKRG
ncbi:MAG: hypothetical protein ACP5GD_01760 [Candidatus Micrarchaeia archaeon]